MSSVATTRLHIKPSFIKYLLPFFCMGWIGSSLIILKDIFSGNGRFLFLVILFLFLATRKNLARFLDARLGFILFTYGTWCLFTSVWSSIPILSVMKGSLYFLTVPILIFAGIEWAKSHSWENTLDYLWMLAFVSLLSALLGHQDNNYYHGLIAGAGANIFGFMTASSFPFFLWMTYRRWHKKIQRMLWSAITASIIYFTFMSMSRACILMLLTVIFCFLLSLRLSKKIVLFSAATITLTGFFVMNPNLFTQLIDSYVYKRHGVQNIFQSREKQWQHSYEGAVEGGWSGLGFGISYSQNDFNFVNGLTTLGYGREKGNSQLTIIEETGIIGFSLYIILLGYLISRFIRLYIKAENHDQRVLIAILAGSFFGMLIQSVFEGWWYAAGGQECIYFWLLVGATRGLEVSLSQHKRVSHATSIEASNRKILAD